MTVFVLNEIPHALRAISRYELQKGVETKFQLLHSSERGT